MNTDTILTSQEIIGTEKQFGAHNYAPIQVVLSRGEGVSVWDVEGRHYYDFLSAYGAVNQGHCHPAIVAAMIEQAGRLTLTSRAFYNDQLGIAEEYICKCFGYDKSLFMNSGVEAVETALKLARKWGYMKKKIPADKSVIVVVEGNFHGRTTGVISFSSDPDVKNGFGPFMQGYEMIPYNNADAFEEVLAREPNICAILIEPIQGEAGVIVPADGYIRRISALCQEYNVLLMADEIQSGLGRTGKMLACEYDEVTPDVLILGKALSGGMLPVSAVLANDGVMLCFLPGEHGSTYGGNPLASAVSVAALEVIRNEKLAENSYSMGIVFRQRMNELMSLRPDLVKAVRGKGLLNAIDIIPTADGLTAMDVCIRLKQAGLLAKPTHQHTIRFSPPLIITRKQLNECCDIIQKVILEF
ncbi:MAG: ornithine--oxo-acid transaminase [Chitinophagaceae bacterium]